MWVSRMWVDEAQELLARLTMAELVELLRMVVDDLELRTMETAGEDEEV